MKKPLCFLTLTLLLLGCSKNAAAPTTLDATADEALSVLSAGRTFTRADEDFIKTNFPDAIIEAAAVYYADDGTEFGIFSVDVSQKETVTAAIRTYLDSEEQSVRSLADLYPADDLNARLSRFDNAQLGSLGDTLVYYLLTDAESARKITRSWS